jgi:hypothetical protein
MLNDIKRSAACVVLSTMILLFACTSNQNSDVAEVHSGDRLTSFAQEITCPVHEFQVKTGGSYTLDINVKNTGAQPWFGGAQPMMVAASYHWLDKGGTVLPIEGNRAQLNRPTVQPGESDQLKLQVVAPPNPGSYTLSVSMVQEGVAWFNTQGAKPLVLQVRVE